MYKEDPKNHFGNWCKRAWFNLNSRASGKYFKNYAYKDHTLTKEEFMKWIIPQEALWKKLRRESGPSIDRIDNTKGYQLSNIQLVSWEFNRAKGQKVSAERLSKPVVGISRKGTSVIWLKSQSEGKYFNLNQSCISACIRGKRPSYRGYVWRLS